MAELARETNRPSDNFNAETLIKALGAEFGTSGTTRAGTVVVRRTMAGFGLRPRVVDGSGLSRSNRTTPRQVVHAARAHGPRRVRARLRDLAPVAGRNGTLDRPHAPQRRARPLQGQDRHAERRLGAAGYCQTTAGSRVAFAFLMNGVNVTRRARCRTGWSQRSRATRPDPRSADARLIDSSASSREYQPSTFTTFHSGVL